MTLPRFRTTLLAVSLLATCLSHSTAAETSGLPLYDFSKLEVVAKGWLVKCKSAVVEHDDQPALELTYAAGKGYPRIELPAGGNADLSAYGGLEADLVNTGTAKLEVWFAASDVAGLTNGNRVPLEPGQSATARIVFGISDGGTGDPLDLKKVKGVRFELKNPTEESVVVVKAVRAVGQGGTKPSGAYLSFPADREKTVKPPDWLGQRPPVEGEWVQTLNETFTGTTLNPELWRCSDRTDSYDKLYLYDPENVAVDHGVLKLTTQRKDQEGFKYTSGQIVSFGKWAQQYGYFEAMMKFPDVRGTFPALWLMPDRDIHGLTDQQSIWNRNSTKNGGMEFDIMEHLTGDYRAGRYDVGLHWDGYAALHKTWGNAQLYYAKTPDNWHAFGMLWEPGKVTWYCDGVKKAEWTNNRVGSVPASFLVSAQMGGWLPENRKIDDANLPAITEIKYVKAWTRKN
ncbi:hypothetical protein BH09VER1_BH09VER1_05030 [soil metagenome]